MQIFKLKQWVSAMVLSASAVGALLLSPGVHAQAGAACSDTGTLEATNACAVQTFQAADAQIAILYGDVMRALSAHERPQLRQEHTAWQRERAARCKQATRESESEPQWPRLYHACLTTETESRRRGLMRWLTMDHPSAKP